MPRPPTKNGTEKMDDACLLGLAERLLGGYAKSHLLLKSFSEIADENEVLSDFAHKLKLSGYLNEEDIGRAGGSGARELMRMVSFGVQRGANVEKSLEMFIARLRREIKIANILKSKAGSMQALTYIGVGIFFPLFSGISAVIVSSSLGLFGKGASSVYGGFVAVCAAYVPITLYLTSAFAHPERTVAANLLSVAPYAILASFILLMTQVYLSNVL